MSFLFAAYADAIADPRSPRRRALRAYGAMRRMIREFYAVDRRPGKKGFLRSPRGVMGYSHDETGDRFERIARYRREMMAKHGEIIADSVSHGVAPDPSPVVVKEWTPGTHVEVQYPEGWYPGTFLGYVAGDCGEDFLRLTVQADNGWFARDAHPVCVRKVETTTPPSGFSEAPAIEPPAVMVEPTRDDRSDVTKRFDVMTYLDGCDNRPSVRSVSLACRVSWKFARKQITARTWQADADPVDSVSHGVEPEADTPPSGFSEVTIKGEPYVVSADESDPSRVFVQAVRKADSDPYCVDGSWLDGCLIDGPHAGLSCECPDFAHRWSQTAGRGCKHITATSEAGLLPIVSPRPAKYTPQIDWDAINDLRIACGYC